MLTQSYPFRRLFVDYLIQGYARIWWQMDPEFNDPQPHVFQLQFGHTGLPTAADWINVGPPITDGVLAVDDKQREYGQTLTSHYRLTLTTPSGTYVSAPVPIRGGLGEHDWLFAREIIRKELMRHNRVSRPGYLLKRMRYGTKCPRCIDSLTEENTDSDCPLCNGTGFITGYHAPLGCQCADFSPETVYEHIDNSKTRGTVRDTSGITARIAAFPAVQSRDVWVDAQSDERYHISEVSVVAHHRGVPLVQSVKMKLIEFSDRIYKVPIGGEPAELDPAELPGVGEGSVAIDHNFGGENNLVYQDAAGNPVVGAIVTAFTTPDYQAALPGRPNPILAVASTSTDANGHWAAALQLDPGPYTLVFEKVGNFGPNTATITVPGAVLPVKQAPKAAAALHFQQDW